MLVRLLCAYVLVAVVAPPPVDANPTVFTVAGVLSDPDKQKLFQDVVHRIGDSGILPPGVVFNSTTILMNPNPIRTALSVCDNLIKSKVYAVVVSHSQGNELSPASVSYTCGFYDIPVIGISARDTVFSDKNIHASFLRTLPPYSHQVDVWIKMVALFGWKAVIFIHTNDRDGRSVLGRLHTLAEENGIQIEKTIEYEPGVTNLTHSFLTEAKEANSRIILMYANAEDAAVIYQAAGGVNMTGSGYVWIVSEEALQVPNRPDGILGLHLSHQEEQAHINDSVMVIAGALVNMMNAHENIMEPPNSCGEQNWKTGKTFYKYLINETLDRGMTGRISFDESGDRLDADYEIINIQKGDRQVTVGICSPSNGPKGKRGAELKLKNETTIIWPGGGTEKPEGYIIPTELRVVTIPDVPFVWTRKLEPGENCSKVDGEVYCPRPNASFPGQDVWEEEHCCYGYCIDLLVKLAEKVNFTFQLHLSADEMYGSYDRRNDSTKQEWNGMIGEVVNGQADMIVAPLTINPERADFIDFSKPFKYQGITILEKKMAKASSLTSFLQPFQDSLWLLVLFCVHLVALVLYLLDRFSPFGRFKLPQSDETEEDALNLSTALWFSWGVILNSGIGEGTPRSFSARVLGMVWAGFAMIIVASYTANLAAFLVLDKPQTTITGINDARLRNPQENFIYATVKDSAVDMYFRRQVELSTMYRTMQGNNYRTAEEAIEHVRIGKLNAFIWDSSRLEYEAAKDCDLVTAGELFGRSGYGIGLPRGSSWTDKVTLTVLDFHESGFMEDLDTKYILVHSTDCSMEEDSPATLGLSNMAGVFILVGGGILAGVFLIFIEIAYKRHQMMKEREMEIARAAAERWRGTIEKRKNVRRKMMLKNMQDASRLHGPNGGMSVSYGGMPEKTPFNPSLATQPYQRPSMGRDSSSDRITFKENLV
ncbi:PREDICTED: glutamate [NMDA] receptor subunit 1-like [Priapulus caudatus]|uniref:Glutamate [NMDA] receptor subunit 1 n=1 Tax=Priapulus caudatus TaxID=37621 RepID=A0ABM1EDE6_PRICU|nr:PREDICTED: glutamate [NMDA] receptor subunit 1-like [Priapulus caudatus]